MGQAREERVQKERRVTCISTYQHARKTELRNRAHPRAIHDITYEGLLQVDLRGILQVDLTR